MVFSEVGRINRRTLPPGSSFHTATPSAMNAIRPSAVQRMMRSMPIMVFPRSCRPRTAFVEKRVGSRSWQPRIRQFLDPKAAAGDQLIDLAVEVATASGTAPKRVKPILPPCDARLRRPPVLDE